MINRTQKLSQFSISVTAFAIMIGASNAASLAPHRAVYDLDMLKSEKSSGFSSIKGRMAYELIGSTCEGWTVNFRIANEFAQTEGDTRLIDSQSTSWESSDGLEFRFSQTEFLNNQKQTEKRVNVARASGTVPAEGKISEPEAKEFKLPTDTVFPMVHQFRLLEAAEKGQTRDTSMIYDGSDMDKSFQAITFIGAKHLPGTIPADLENKQAEPLKTLNSWPITISYYPAEDKSADTPSYQVNLNMYENGVSTAITLDYGSFALKGQLANLEMLKAEPCK